MYDHAQSPRLGQRTAVENPGVQLVTEETLPEVAYRGQIVYALDLDQFKVYDGVAWQNPTSAVTGGTQTFIGPDEPVADAVGDLWMNNTTFQLSIWDGAAWQLVVDERVDQLQLDLSAAQADATQALQDASTAQDTADGKITTFYQPAAPTAGVENPAHGDLWINTASNRLYRYDPALTDPWVEIQDVDIAAAINAAGTAQTTADAKIESFYTTWEARPLTGGANGIGDLLFATNQGNKPYRWDGTSWIAIQDASIGTAAASAAAANTAATDAMTAATAAQATADGAISTYYLADPPWANGSTQPASKTGDLWFDTDTNQAYRWNGTTWLLIEDNQIALALSRAQDAQTTADGKITSFYTPDASVPTAEGTGDLWYVTDKDNLVRFWDTSRTPDAWVDLAVGTDALSDNAVNADKIQAGAITADLLEASLTLSTVISTRTKNANGGLTGSGVDLTPTGLYAYDVNGKKIIELPNDPKLPAVFRGDAEIAHLTVQTLTTLQETLLAQASKLTLQNSISPPSNPPTPTPTYTSFQTVGADWATYRWGWTTDGTYGYTAYRPNSSQSYIERWDLTTGAVTRSAVHSSANYFSVVAWGGYIYAAYRVYGGANTAWYVARWNASTLAFVDYAPLPVTSNYGVGIGLDNTLGKLYAAWIDVTTSHVIISQIASYTSPGTPMSLTSVDTGKTFTGTHMASIQVGAFDFGATRYVVSNRGVTSPVVFDSTYTEMTNETWPKANGVQTVGVTYNYTTSKFQSMDINGLLSYYEGGTHYWTDPTLSTWHASYSWSNGTVQTTTSDPQSFTMAKRAKLLVNTPNLPSGVSQAWIFLDRGTAIPTPGTVSTKKQGVSTGTAGLLISQADFTKADDNVITNGFGSGTPAEFRSQVNDWTGTAPLISMKGDGTTRIGPITTDTAGKSNVVQQVASASIATTNGLGASGVEVMRIATNSFEARLNQRYRVYATCAPSNATAGAYSQGWLKWDTTNTGITGTQIATGLKDHRLASRAETLVLMGEFTWTGTDRATTYVKLTMAGQGGAGTDNAATYGPTRVWVEAT